MDGRNDLPEVWAGALLGILVTLAAVSISYLGRGLAGLPFVPFDAFDWLARVLPGPLVTTAIDTMVSVIRSLGIEELSGTAKGLEQAMAVALALLTGAFLSALAFRGARKSDQLRGGGVHWLARGSVLGLGVGVCLLLVSLDVNRTATAGPLSRAVWILVLSLGWGRGSSPERKAEPPGTVSSPGPQAIRFRTPMPGCSRCLAPGPSSRP